MSHKKSCLFKVTASGIVQLDYNPRSGNLFFILFPSNASPDASLSCEAAVHTWLTPASPHTYASKSVQLLLVLQISNQHAIVTWLCLLLWRLCLDISFHEIIVYVLSILLFIILSKTSSSSVFSFLFSHHWLISLVMKATLSLPMFNVLVRDDICFRETWMIKNIQY